MDNNYKRISLVSVCINRKTNTVRYVDASDITIDTDGTTIADLLDNVKKLDAKNELIENKLNEITLKYNALISRVKMMDAKTLLQLEESKDQEE